MPSLANLLEDYRNWRGRQDWESGKGWQDFYGGDPDMQERMERFQGFGTGSHGLSGLSGLAGAIKASHGSPHAFDKFDMSKIGTGEGAQAYGHGLYYAQGFDSPVAKEYAEKLSNIDQFSGLADAHLNAQNQVKRFGNDPEWAAEVVTDAMRNFQPNDIEYKSLADTLKIIQSGDYAKPLASKGHLYNVSLEWPNAAREASDPLSEHHLLDWFEPLSKQSEHVKKALRDYATLSGKEHYVPEWADTPVYTGEGISPDTRGKEFYEWLASQPLDIKGLASRELASDALKAFDVPGIKYWDEGSRGAREGTRNYVMFDENIPKIISRNGVSLTDLLRR